MMIKQNMLDLTPPVDLGHAMMILKIQNSSNVAVVEQEAEIEEFVVGTY